MVNVVLTSLSGRSFESWLKVERHCVSSAFFCLASASLLLITTAFYLSSERKLSKFLRHKVINRQEPCFNPSRLIERCQSTVSEIPTWMWIHSESSLVDSDSNKIYF